MIEDLFSVFEWFPDETYQCVGSALGAEAAVKRAQVSTRKPATLLGIIKKVTITDSGDFTVFLWQDGKVVFPPPTADERGSFASATTSPTKHHHEG
jgi:hypothetical protein